MSQTYTVEITDNHKVTVATVHMGSHGKVFNWTNELAPLLNDSIKITALDGSTELLTVGDLKRVHGSLTF